MNALQKLYSGLLIGRERLTPDLYKELKKYNIQDQEILKNMKIGSSTLTRFKKKHGLTTYRTRRPQVEPLQEELDTQHEEVFELLDKMTESKKKRQDYVQKVDSFLLQVENSETLEEAQHAANNARRCLYSLLKSI